MRKSISLIVAAVCITCLIVSCKKDYQKLSIDFIRNLPDTCVLLVQVENEAEHLVYYKGNSLDMFFCYNIDNEKTEIVQIPVVDGYDAPITIIGAGKENIILGHKINADDSDEPNLPQAYVQFYDLKTQKFKKFTTCNWYEFDEGTKQLSCFTFDIDRFGDGKRTTDIYDFDGNLLSKKDVEVCGLMEVPTGTLAAKSQAVNQTYDVSWESSDRPVYYCELCGAEFTSVQSLTINSCSRIKGKHKLYEGSPKSEYTCKYCGQKSHSIRTLTMNRCHKNPYDNRHAPAL